MNNFKSGNFIQDVHKEFENELISVNELILNQLECGQEIIYEAGKYLITSGGKRIRPLLVLISSRIFGQNNNACISLAAATEFIHAATLLHDDVVDSSMLRRFKATVNSVWGNQEAVLVGDFLFSKSFQLMVYANCLECLKCLSNASSTIAIGEVNQLSLNKSKKILSDEAEYFKIIEAKTAELMAAATKVGAIIAGASISDQEHLYDFGKILGVIFQIKDDLLDYFSSSEEIGKNIGDDFNESKITLPIIYLHNNASVEDKAEVEMIFNKDYNRTSKDLKKIIILLSKYDISKKLAQRIENLRNQALEKLDMLSVKNNKNCELLRKLLIFASEREI